MQGRYYTPFFFAVQKKKYNLHETFIFVERLVNKKGATMPKTDGYKTRDKILTAAEKIFSEKGFAGTSISMISREASVNKALIYYHFENKNDIIVSLIRNIIDEVNEKVSKSFSMRNTFENLPPKEKLRQEMKFMFDRKKILSIMLMESLKADDQDNFLFQCADLIMNSTGRMEADSTNEKKMEIDKFKVYEFFTGILPMLLFSILNRKWSNYHEINEDRLLELFTDVMVETHLKDHPVPE